MILLEVTSVFNYNFFTVTAITTWAKVAANLIYWARLIYSFTGYIRTTDELLSTVAKDDNYSIV